VKPLDIVRTKAGSIALVTETNNKGTQASLDYIYEVKPDGLNGEKNAWWREDFPGDKLTILTSLPLLLSKAMSHPMGSGDEDAEYFFNNKWRLM